LRGIYWRDSGFMGLWVVQAVKAVKAFKAFQTFADPHHIPTQWAFKMGKK